MSFDPGAPGLSGHAFGLPHSVDEARVVLVPVPFEATTSYGGGAAEGPAAVLQRLAARWTSSTSRPAGPTRTASPCSPRSPGCAPGTREAKRLAAPIMEAGGAHARGRVPGRG